MRLGRRALLAGALALATLAATAAPAAASSPTHTNTKVNLIVDDAGLHATPSAIPSGHIEWTVKDQRSNRQGAIEIRSPLIPGIHFRVGKTQFDIRTMRSALPLGVYVDGQSNFMSTTVSTGVVPALSNHDPAGVVRFLAKNVGLRTPYRETRFDEPVVPFAQNPVPENRPYTTAAAGVTKLQFRNLTSNIQSCALQQGLTETRVSLATPKTVEMTVTLLAGSGPNTISCRTFQGATTLYYDLWVN